MVDVDHFERKRGKLEVWATRDNRAQVDREANVGKRAPLVSVFSPGHFTCSGIDLTPSQAAWLAKMLVKAEDFVR